MLDTAPGNTDPDRAKALLKQAGYAPGELELSFPYPDDLPFSEELRKVFVDSFTAAGFKARPLGFPDDSVDRVKNDQSAPFNIRQAGWCSDWQSGTSWFPLLFHSQGRDNASMFAEQAIDDEIDRIGELPFEDQPAAWGALDKSIMTDYYPAVIIGYPAAAMLHGPRIGGMNTDSALLGMPTWKDIYVVQ